MDVRADAQPLARLRAAWRHVGLLVAIALVAFAAAAWVQGHSTLPARYSWLEPLSTLLSIAAEPWFAASMVAAYALGRLRCRAEWKLRPPAASYDLGILTSPRARRIAVAAAGLLLAEGFLFPRHNTVDHLAILALAFIVAWEPARRDWRRMLAETGAATLVFVAICYCYTVFKALTFVVHTPVDERIIAFGRALTGVDAYRAIASWSARYPWLVELCDWVYFKFFLHMALTTALLLGLRRPRERLEYLAALALCYFIGGPLYHLCPAVGPSYAHPEAYAHLRTLPLVSNSIHDWIGGNTAAVVQKSARELHTWAYVACMPSLHVAHESVMLWYARRSRGGVVIAAAFTLLTMLSVVVLGWHYPSDIVAGVVVGAIAIALAHWQRDTLLPARIMPPADEPLPPRASAIALLAKLRR